MLLSKFANEVLSRGAEALLPQNLNREWMTALQKMADDFLDLNFQTGDCSDVGDDVDPILSACVSELLSHRQGGAAEITADDLIKKITIYCIQITIETIRRESGSDLRPTTVDTILDADQLAELSNVYPEMADFLDRVCLAKD
jgi:hypothetical protein